MGKRPRKPQYLQANTCPMCGASLYLEGCKVAGGDEEIGREMQCQRCDTRWVQWEKLDYAPPWMITVGGEDYEIPERQQIAVDYPLLSQEMDALGRAINRAKGRDRELLEGLANLIGEIWWSQPFTARSDGQGHKVLPGGRRKEVTITVAGGCVQGVDGPPGLVVKVNDYDVEGRDVEGNDRAGQDENGDWYEQLRFDVPDETEEMPKEASEDDSQ